MDFFAATYACVRADSSIARAMSAKPNSRRARGFAVALAVIALALSGCSASTMPRMDPTSRPRPVASHESARHAEPVARPARSARE